MYIKRLILSAILLPQFLSAQIIPADRKTDWSLAGYRDSIPTYSNEVNITAFGGIGDGTTTNNTALQNAIASLNGGSGTIYFPSGNFLFTASITLRDSLILKGNSSDSTILSFNLNGSGDLIRMAGTISSTSAIISSDAYKDSTFIVVDNPSSFAPGDYIKLTQNDSALVSSSWAYGTVGQIVQVIDIAGNRINLNSPLRKPYLVTENCKVRKITPRKNVGIECLKMKRLDSSVGQTTNIDLNYAVKCWIKGVEGDMCNFGHIVISNSSNIEVSGCFLHDAFAYGDGGQGYGVVVQYTSGECLVENNIFNHLRHSMLLQAGANGNVFAYNSSTNPYWVSGSLPAAAAGDMVLHGSYPFLNLLESNTGQNIIIDDSHGINGNYNTFFRNRADLYGIFMNSNPASNNQNFVGNEITNAGFLMGFYQLSGTGHLAHGNNIRGTVMPNGTNILSDTSYYKQTKPGFFAPNSTWPAIGIPNIIGIGSIPARQRQLSGTYFTDCSTNYPFIQLDKYTNIAGEFCIGASYNFNGTTLMTGGVFIDTIQTNNGYDSIVTLQLTMLLTDTTYIFDSICSGSNYDFNGQLLDTPGTYFNHLINRNTCDSLVIFQLFVKVIDTSITANALSLVSNETNASYQWIDCSNDSAITGANDQTFSVTQTGNYKVRITMSGCEAESDCEEVVINGILKDEEFSFSIQPNPVTDICTINLYNTSIFSGAVYNVVGEKVLSLFKDIRTQHYSFNAKTLESGFYFIRITDSKGRAQTERVVIER